MNSNDEKQLIEKIIEKITATKKVIALSCRDYVAGFSYLIFADVSMYSVNCYWTPIEIDYEIYGAVERCFDYEIDRECRLRKVKEYLNNLGFMYDVEDYNAFVDNLYPIYDRKLDFEVIVYGDEISFENSNIGDVHYYENY